MDPGCPLTQRNGEWEMGAWEQIQLVAVCTYMCIYGVLHGSSYVATVVVLYDIRVSGICSEVCNTHVSTRTIVVSKILSIIYNLQQY